MGEVIARQNKKLLWASAKKNSNAVQGREQHCKKYAISSDFGILLQKGKIEILPELKAIRNVPAGETSDLERVIFLNPWFKTLDKT